MSKTISRLPLGCAWMTEILRENVRTGTLIISNRITVDLDRNSAWKVIKLKFVVFIFLQECRITMDRVGIRFLLSLGSIKSVITFLFQVFPNIGLTKIASIQMGLNYFGKKR